MNETHERGAMCLVTAIIKPYKLDDVRDALLELGIAGMTVTDVHGFGRQQGRVVVCDGIEEDLDFLPKVKVEVALRRCDLEACVNRIVGAVDTGKIGDGKIFVVTLDNAIGVRTGDSGPKALVPSNMETEVARALA
jgi:nitrogen regulatory protein P-II 2